MRRSGAVVESKETAGGEEWHGVAARGLGESAGSAPHWSSPCCGALRAAVRGLPARFPHDAHVQVRPYSAGGRPPEGDVH